ncbi:unnamed protein product [Symbiodinium sp. CCMP2592]|nr:unnamed protein product [Symbiodinium sp. CCMP2592]
MSSRILGQAATREALATAPASWGQDLLEKSEKALEKWGCVLLRGLLTPEDVISLRKAFGLGGHPGPREFAPPRRAAEVGLWVQQHDPNVSMGRYTFGRLHLLLRGSPEYEPAAVSPHASLAPLVHKHFEIQDMAGRRVFLSEAQLVIADPFAEVQQWHMDAASGRGLSVFLPLQNVAADRGPQELLPGTHALHDYRRGLQERFRDCFRSLCATHGTVKTAEGAEARHGLQGGRLKISSSPAMRASSLPSRREK